MRKIDALILACTHYPLIRKEIEEYYRQKVRIIDSAEIVAEMVFNKLADMAMLNTGKTAASKFFVSDYTDSFAESTKIFYQGKIQLQQFSLWENE